MRGVSLRRSRSGFTLLEILLAVAMGSAILTFATAFLFSLGELWGVGANTRLFKKHARGVSRFVENAIVTASSRYEEQEGSASSPVYWYQWEGDSRSTEEFLTFELETAPGALVWPDQPLPHVVCSLDFDEGQGLFLLWRSRLEQAFEEEAPRKTLISPFVSSVRYHYIDYAVENPEWEVTESPKVNPDQSHVLPQRIELVFAYRGDEITRQLVLPGFLGGVPSF